MSALWKLGRRNSMYSPIEIPTGREKVTVMADWTLVEGAEYAIVASQNPLQTLFVTAYAVGIFPDAIVPKTREA